MSTFACVFENAATVISLPRLLSSICIRQLSYELDDDPDGMTRRRDEISYLQTKWRHLLDNDPYYSPNFELATTDSFSLGYPFQTRQTLDNRR